VIGYDLSPTAGYLGDHKAVSWRDSAPDAVQRDLDSLLDAALPLGQQHLEKYGEFYPFGVVMTVKGTTSLVAPDPAELGEHPVSADVLALLLERTRERRDDLRAVALCSDVAVPDGDGIRVVLEHAEGPAMAVLMPYKRKRFGNRIEYGDLRAASANPAIWSSHDAG
jgi:hypothetical protein